jgi:hypothetical protein
MDLDDIKSSLTVSSQNVKHKQQNIAMMTTRVPSKKSKKMQTDQAKTNLRLKSPFKRKIIAKKCKQLNYHKNDLLISTPRPIIDRAGKQKKAKNANQVDASSTPKDDQCNIH